MGSRLFHRWSFAAALSCLVAPAIAQSDRVRGLDLPAPLSLQPNYEYESVYAPPEAPREGEGLNEGGVHIELAVSYLTDYMFRGIDRSENLELTDPLGVIPPDFQPSGSEDAANLQIYSKLEWDLGRLPHPFVGVFVNVYDADPVSQFQEIRPFFGAEWTIRPFILAGGNNSFIFPDRDPFNTAEAFASLTIDDSYFFRTVRPVLSPYVFAAYDYDLYDGLYLEAGFNHEVEFEDLDIVLIGHAHVAYVESNKQFIYLDPGEDSGWHHYQIGLTGRYMLNDALRIPARYGDWSFEGYVYYTDGIDNDLRSNTQVWGGGGIRFRY